MSWQNVVEGTVVGLGYDLVEVERSARGLVRVTIDRLPGDPRGEFIVVEDCERVTRQLQHVLEVEGLAYERLEVSSPGLDRPLKKDADFRRFAGEMATLTLKAPFQGRKRFQGQLLAPEAADGNWRLLLVEPPAATAKPARPAKPGKAAARPAAAVATAVAQTDPVLEFRLDEVRDAHLVPVVDFKGRRFRPDGSHDPATASTPPDNEAAQ